MRRITAFWEAFFSKNLYTEAFYSWKGIGFLSLFLLGLLQTLIIFGQIQVGLLGFLHKEGPDIVKQIPPITFNEGKASTPEAIAYQIKAPKSGELIAIIDTRTSQPPTDLGGAPIFIAGEKATMKKSEVEQRSYDYRSMGNMTVDQPLINHWLDLVGTWTGIVCAPFILFGFTFWRLIELLLFSLVTLLVCNIRGVHGSYAAMLRITALAMIPGLIYTLILCITGTDFFGTNLLFIVVVIAYIIFGVGAVRENSEPAESPGGLPPLP